MFLLADRRKVGKIHQTIFLIIAFLPSSFSQKFGQHWMDMKNKLQDCQGSKLTAVRLFQTTKIINGANNNFCAEWLPLGQPKLLRQLFNLERFMMPKG